MRRLTWAVLGLGFLGGFLGGYFHERDAAASRNSSGNYSLPSPANPVVTGTTIKSTDFNTTMSDVAAEITNSFDRLGRGCMTAPAQMSSGTVSAPGLTFCAEPASGLYRSGTNDIRMSVNSTDDTKWTGSGFFTLAGLTATQTATNTPAITATGNGTAVGISSTGGSSSGAGISGTGGATNGAGVSGTGAGSGAGLSGTGGGTNGYGVSGTGGATNGSGVQGVGAGSGNGGVFTGGASAGNGVVCTGGASSGIGVNGTGGSPNGTGVYGAGTGGGNGVQGVGASGLGVLGLGGGTSAGGSFANGTAATSSTRYDAVTLQNGDLNMSGVANLSYNTWVTNRLTPNGIVKASFAPNTGASPTLASAVGGFGATSISCASNNITVTLGGQMAGIIPLCIANSAGHVPFIASVATTNPSTITIGSYAIAGGTQDNLCSAGLSFYCVVFGTE